MLVFHMGLLQLFAYNLNPLSASGPLLGHYMVPLSASGPLLGHCLFVIRKMHLQQIYALTYIKNCKIRNITVIKGHKKGKRCLVMT